MTGRMFTGALVGALILFFSGFFWFGLSPIGDAPFAKLPNEQAVVQTIVDSKLESGTYIYPKMDRNGGATSFAEWSALHEKGPLFEVRYHADGAAVGGAGMMIYGFLHFLLAALVAAGLMRMALPMLGTYGRRVMFVAGLGLFAGVFIQMSGPIWFYYPWDRALSDLGYDILSWLLAGLGMAAIIKPATMAAPLAAEKRVAVAA
jgi:hypothetical protein